jgi:hypothetical protein
MARPVVLSAHSVVTSSKPPTRATLKGRTASR